MNIDANIGIYFNPCWVLAFQRYVCLPAKQLVLWCVLKQQGAELGLAVKTKSLAFPLKILNKVDWFLAVPHLLPPRKRNPSPGHTVVPLQSLFLRALWGRAANSGNTSGVGAGYGIYSNPAVSPGRQPLVPAVLPAAEGAAGAEHGMVPHQQHGLGPCRAGLCVGSRHESRTLRCFYLQRIRSAPYGNWTVALAGVSCQQCLADLPHRWLSRVRHSPPP